MFKVIPTLEELEKNYNLYLIKLMGVEFTEITSNTLSAKMPVDERTMQAFRLLHGGASVVLAESLGSIAANLCVDFEKFYCVGLDINANHIRSATSGYVYATTTPIHIGRSTQVWEISIKDDDNKLICISRLTMAVVSRKK